MSDADFDPGPCPRCGQRNYRINWVGVGTEDDPYAQVPGTVTCLNPQCPGRIENEDGEAESNPQLGSGWDNADRKLAGIVHRDMFDYMRTLAYTPLEALLSWVVTVAQRESVEPVGTLTTKRVDSMFDDDWAIRWELTPPASSSHP